MGCATSKDEPIDAKQVNIETTQETAQSAADKKERSTQKWSMMESAEEKGFLRTEQEDAESDVDAALRSEFPGLEKSHSKFGLPSTWKELAADIEYEAGDVELKPPWTLQKAHAFYYFLCQTDDRRRNNNRPDANPSIPRRSVYEIVSAAYELYDQRANEHGALQRVPAPTKPTEKLKVCGDTHGQLQDVLWIFDEHGEPSATNAFLFNGDIADRGKERARRSNHSLTQLTSVCSSTALCPLSHSL